FLIGARIHSKLQAVQVFVDLGGRRGMNHMLKHLTEHPEEGLLGYQAAGFTIIQCWRSFEHRGALAKDTAAAHPAALRSSCRTVATIEPAMRPPRVPTVTHELYRQLTLVALGLIATIIVTGASVRLSGSGLGCDRWPTCTSHELISVSNPNRAVEQINRLFTG